MILYGSGTTVGIALSETLHLHGLSKPNFLVGCSVLSSHQPAGIAGFGRGLSSLPSQLGLVTDYKRIKEFEDVVGLGPCFNVYDAKTVSFLELRLYFKGGADVALPGWKNYFAFVGGGVACLTMVTGPERVDGPGMILGSFQMQNFYVEYDLRNEKLGFKQEKCK
ncbi:hypothetical protein OIU78_029530 [Salix suchowensis]|nr:hypothetical protein OIU78_029530 [Salix suchowensis]